MSTEFSSLELQLIRSSLATKTDAELAELLERPVEEITSKIRQITGTDPIERNSRVTEVKDIIRKQEAQKQDVRRKKEQALKLRQEQAQARNREKAVTDRKEKQEAEKKEAINHQVRQNRDAWLKRQTVKTRVVDYSQMKTIKVSKGTYVQVPVTMSEEEAIAKYFYNLEKNGKWIKPGTNNKPAIEI